MLMHSIVFIPLLVTIVSAENCPQEFENHYSCIEKGLEEYVNTYLKPNDLQTLSKAGVACFTSNGCKAPPESKDTKEPINDASAADDDDDAGDVFTFGLEAIQVRHALNPSLFPGTQARNLTLTEEECIGQLDGTAMSTIEKCVQKKWANFKFPVDSGLPTVADYMESVGDTLDALVSGYDDLAHGYLRAVRGEHYCAKDKGEAVQKCLTDLFKQKQKSSFDRMIALEQIFKELCKIGKQCFEKTKEECRPWINEANQVSCDCAQTEMDAIINTMQERYDKCLQTKPQKEALTAVYTKMMKKSCEMLKEDKSRCARISAGN